jgi:hypothetical protein
MADEQDKMMRDWDFDINLSGISAPTGKGALSVPEGFYSVDLTDLYINPEKPDRVIIKMLINDGIYKGVVRTDGLNRPKSAEDKVRYYWRALAESAGFTPAQLDAGSVKLGPGTFKGKKAFIHYIPRPDENSYDRTVFLAKGEWQAQKDQFATVQAAGGNKPTDNGATQSGGAVPTKGDVLKSLGIQ